MQRFPLSIEVLGPILTRGLQPGAFGVDAAAARDAEGLIYLAGSHILGKARDALSTLSMCKSDWLPSNWERDWFGGAGDEAEGQHRGRIFLGDLRPKDQPPYDPKSNPRTRSRVAIDPLTGAALDRALVVMEHPYRSGEMVTFAGMLTVLGPDAMVIRNAVERALLWITNAGGLRTVGHGRVVGAQVGEALAKDDAETPRPSDRFAITLKFEDPFCIATRRIADNIYEGVDVVPGGAIKGALAAQLARDYGASPQALEQAPGAFPTLRAHFARVRFTHAFPVGSLGLVADRPRARPLSLAYCDGVSAVRDFALADGAALVGGRAPVFAPDFKAATWQAAGEEWPWPDVARDLRIHTAMQAKLRAGMPEALFALEARAVHEHQWIGSVDLDGVPAAERKVVAQELQSALADGLAGIGRTHAFAQISFSAVPDLEPIRSRKEHVLVLQTPALLRQPDLAGELGEPTRERLKATYEETFRQLSDGKLVLKRLFVRERLAGAKFMAARFFQGRVYRPFLLTEEGSTFVLEGSSQESIAALQRWARRGLPLAPMVARDYEIGSLSSQDAASDSYDESGAWKQCPYLRQNGYGEVAVDDPRHDRLTPAVTEVDKVAAIAGA